MIQQPSRTRCLRDVEARTRRLRDVEPLTKRKAFAIWLAENNATRPLIAGLPKGEQDGFFESDLAAFESGSKPFQIGDE